ncbi:MAG: Lrp/AsnC family transcriptional regulator [Candidatus Odinarchaeia archaeon]
MAIVFVHLKVAPNKIHEIWKKIRELDYVKEAFVITGDYDIIAKLEAPDVSYASKIIIEYILKMEGVERSSSSIVLPQNE